MAPMFPSGIFSTLCLLSLRRFFSAFQTFCDIVESKKGNAWYFLFFFFFSKGQDEKGNLFNKDKQVSPVKLDLICATFYSAQLNSFPKCLFFKNKISPSFSYVGSKTIMDFKIHGNFHILLQVSAVDNRTGYVLRAAGLLKLPSVQWLHIHTEPLSKQLSCMLFIPPLLSFLC